MSCQKNKNDYQQKILIKLKILDIFPLKEDIKSTLSEYSLKFEDTNNNKYNIYSLLYMINNTIILIPTNNAIKEKLTVDLIMDHDKFISRGILYFNNNSKEQIIKFCILNKYINIKFHYNLNFINSGNENKNKRSQIKFKCHKKKDSNNRNNNINQSCHNSSFSNIKYNNKNINIKILKNNKDNFDLYSSERKNDIHFNVNKSQIIFPCNLIINNNKDTYTNKNNYSEIWINDTKMFIKKIKKYISLRNNRNDTQKEFKKCLSAKNIYSFMDCSNKFINSNSSRKTSMKHVISNESNSSYDSQKISNKFNLKEIPTIEKYNTENKLNNVVNNINDNLCTKSKYQKYLTSANCNKRAFNNSVKKNIKKELLNKFNMEVINNENNNENIEKNISSTKNLKIENKENNNDKVSISNSIKNKLYTKKIIKNIYENKMDLFPIKFNIINIKRKEKTNKNDIKSELISDDKFLEKKEYSIKNYEPNSNKEICSFQKFYNLKNIFYLQYNKKYINNIKDESLRLEIELLLEKFNELVYEYHKSISKEKLLYKYLLISRKNYKNLIKINYNLEKKLKEIIEKREEKIDNININNKDLLKLKNEIALFEYLFKNEGSEINNDNNLEKKISKTNILSKMLKNILIKILKKTNNLDLVKKHEKYKTWINNNIIRNEEDYYNIETINKERNIKNKIKIEFKSGK